MTEPFVDGNVVDLRGHPSRRATPPRDRWGSEAMEQLQEARRELAEVDAAAAITPELEARIRGLHERVLRSRVLLGVVLSDVEEIHVQCREVGREQERRLDERFDGDIPDDCQLAFEIDTGFHQLWEDLGELADMLHAGLSDYHD